MVRILRNKMLEIDESDDVESVQAILASEAEDDSAYCIVKQLTSQNLHWNGGILFTIASSGKLDKKSLSKLFEKWIINILENRGNLGHM